MVPVVSRVNLNGVQCLYHQSSCTAACRTWTYLTNCTGPLERRSVALQLCSVTAGFHLFSFFFKYWCQNSASYFPDVKCCLSEIITARGCSSSTFRLVCRLFFQGYTAHIVSTVSEWFLAFSFISFFFTYIRDFQVLHLVCSPTQLLLKEVLLL